MSHDMGCVVLGKLHYPESMLCVLRRTLYTANESLRDAMLPIATSVPAEERYSGRPGINILRISETGAAC